MTRTVLITGCLSGIGRATAHHFGKHGWKVVATTRNKADAGDLVGHDNVHVARLDLTVTQAPSSQSTTGDSVLAGSTS